MVYKVKFVSLSGYSIVCVSPKPNIGLCWNSSCSFELREEKPLKFCHMYFRYLEFFQSSVELFDQ